MDHFWIFIEQSNVKSLPQGPNSGNLEVLIQGRKLLCHNTMDGLILVKLGVCIRAVETHMNVQKYTKRGFLYTMLPWKDTTMEKCRA